MAEGWLKHFTSSENVEVYSAGTKPEVVNPYAVKVMSIEGIDISSNKSNNVDEYKDIEFNFVITVCDNAKERCPYFPNTATKLHQSFHDPANATGTDSDQLKVYMEVRDQLKEYFKKFTKDNFLSKY
jgi:arsenate reductase (thioredoxin)